MAYSYDLSLLSYIVMHIKMINDTFETHHRTATASERERESSSLPVYVFPVCVSAARVVCACAGRFVLCGRSAVRCPTLGKGAALWRVWRGERRDICLGG